MAVTPVILCLNKAGEPLAQKLSALLNAPIHGRAGRVTTAHATFPNALDHARDLFAAGTPIIGVCASGILIRAVAPMLNDKTKEPPVISVSDDGKVVVPLLGGHRGANRLAREIANKINAIAAVTTAGDVALGVALDEPPEGFVLANPDRARDVMARMLNGEGATIIGDAPWLNTLPAGEITISCGTAPSDADLVFHPQTITLGVGCARNCPPQELEALVMRALRVSNIAPEAIHSLSTLDLKADEPAVLALAARLNRPLRLFTAKELDAQTPALANPSEVVFAEVGTHGVCEAAALAQSDGKLLVEKTKAAMATCAVSISETPLTVLKGRARGKVSIVSIGPGQSSWRAPHASRQVVEADELVGYGLYIDLLGPLAAGKKRTDFPLGGEEDRCRYALEEAGKGKSVALICSGDAGIYAMGALVFELLDRGPDEMGVSDAARRVAIESSPGVSALQGAAARAGAPLGHDFCAISLSDLLTPRADILKRLKAAAEGDFVIAFYNPVSKRRRTLLAEARDILLEHRPADTPVMLASSLGRPEENIRYRALSELQVDEVDMLTVVLVGSSHTRLAQLGEGPRMFTPRGYARKIDGDLAEAARRSAAPIAPPTLPHGVE